jgi:hypothetical protein
MPQERAEPEHTRATHARTHTRATPPPRRRRAYGTPTARQHPPTSMAAATARTQKTHFRNADC